MTVKDFGLIKILNDKLTSAKPDETATKLKW